MDYLRNLDLGKVQVNLRDYSLNVGSLDLDLGSYYLGFVGFRVMFGGFWFDNGGRRGVSSHRNGGCGDTNGV